MWEFKLKKRIGDEIPRLTLAACEFQEARTDLLSEHFGKVYSGCERVFRQPLDLQVIHGMTNIQQSFVNGHRLNLVCEGEENSIKFERQFFVPWIQSVNSLEPSRKDLLLKLIW